MAAVTPANRLRSLVKEATQGHAYALETLRARAPQLAELVADMAEALDESQAELSPAFFGLKQRNADLLAALDALFPEDSA